LTSSEFEKTSEERTIAVDSNESDNGKSDVASKGSEFANSALAGSGELGLNSVLAVAIGERVREGDSERDLVGDGEWEMVGFGELEG
jgi:hypothetical protein